MNSNFLHASDLENQMDIKLIYNELSIFFYVIV